MNPNTRPLKRAALAAALSRIPALKPLLQTLVCLGLFALISPAHAPAQSGGSGAIVGRVFNPATQEYIRNAAVIVDGTSINVTSSEGGFYRIDNVPAGSVTVVVRYSGYQNSTASVTVTAGETAVQDFEIISTAARAVADGGEALVLDAYVVSSEREGNSKAIMSQKRNMNITTTLASDIFGDVTDGNVGEFLKFLPGVDVDYVESEARGPRLGGMDAQYVGVTFDGIRVASADANRTGSLGRATSFEAFSISSIEAIEINLTASSDQDADSPAGTINMKTRRAFDRKGRRISYNVSMNMNSDEFHFKKTPTPDDRDRRTTRGNYSLEYSDVFLGGRLGIVASHSHANSYTEQYRVTTDYNRSTTSSDTRPLAIWRIDFKDGPKFIVKDTYTFTADYKATDRLTLSLTGIYNFTDGEFHNRNIQFNAATNNTNSSTGRQNSLGDLTTVRTNGATSNTARNVSLGGTSASKHTHTVTFAPKVEYRWNNWTFDASGTYSRSINNYEGIEEGFVRSEPLNNISSDWIATRPNVQSNEWSFRQTSGANWFDLSNFKNPRITNEGRFARTEIYSGDLNARWATSIRGIPTVVKFGGKWTEEGRKNTNETSFNTWQYVGPGGGTTGSFAAYPTRNHFDMGTTNALTITNIAGLQGMIPRPNRNALADLFKTNPEFFVNNASADNYYNAFIAPRRDIVQTVDALYGMTDMNLSRQLQLRAGVRWEGTTNDATEYDPLGKAEMLAAGHAVNSSGRATTIPGYQYQYFTNPRATRTKKYDNLFPMVSLKYTISDNFQLHVSANKAISRPPIDDLTGAWVINDDSQRVTGSNPNLLPEYSKNYVARLAYYFEPAGQLSLTARQNNIENLREKRIGTADEFGNTDPDLAGYTFEAPFNVPNPVRFRSLEFAYSQSLNFLPDMLRGTTVNLSYTRTYASERRQRLAPHRLTAGLGYSYKRLALRAGWWWHDNIPWDSVVGRYKRHNGQVDLSGSWRLNERVSLYFQGRNINNNSVLWYESPAIEGQGGAARMLENYGANWVFGVKGTF